MKAKIVPEKTNLHPRNLHKFGYDFEALTTCSSELKNHVFTNEYDTQTINFSNPEAVKALNNALLIAYYNIKNWGIPQDYLCPPIPGRADYLHYIADLLATTNNQIIPEGENVIGLDIGIGANCIYPIIGNAIYDWSFVGTDIDEKAIQNCKKIIENNPKLIDAISLQQQVESRFIFKNIILTDDKFAFTICNPPFHNSAAEATKSSARKVNNLQEIRTKNPVLNFGGQNTELWCDGGEIGFITQMIYESAKYPMQVLWFTTLVSKRENLSSIYKTLNKVSAVEIKTIDMAQGQKNSRIVAWTFLSELQQKAWRF
ncbi:23S rRNA methyltransferase [Flavobacterium psychrophilum]|uniref:Ribosomal RNA large subunit methyltransferase F n=1 Tax=Flavobacterium psychrophilum (strain ATCC 49511 / DSM 21280 / CIP 103535 / JIP02/86) TaxID=402612 RepID=RLMF_FLAPJ|nr:23S rRNA (adenine(1618)-N(6))-methyltransferase RlmF [Flavobacterium psychrophilum]A6H0G2.1 RecName: Full=Ribosomal RNA large subunit methyltransferase F; AltName: Full=23S rRNA mA1618 methyltransferase; AltName: Full=rRNA adenine N-6-methyltransferase [Flavobacterium psychrophilum JIP02/86]AIG30521.1 23S rRNA methyltransferase [Flavobacterium psychrophilum]AIG32796.1 23S rRNA methyltransferase [Flavobacterium psychrophilum]AIG34951.1 23S rRNA methyltransferase [Flavobacterium psychrophilum]